MPAGGALLACITLWVVLMLDVDKLLAWKDLAASGADTSLLEAAAPEPASSPPDSPDAGCRSEVHPLGTGGSDYDGPAGAEKLPGGHDAMQAEAGWAHRSVDLASGLMARGAALASERQQLHEPAPRSVHAHAPALSSQSVSASMTSEAHTASSRAASHDPPAG